MKTIFHRMLQEILDAGDGFASDTMLIQYSRELIAKKSLLPCLYRYSKADYNNIRAFENRSIFLAKVGSLNDIFEGFSSESYYDIETELECISDAAYAKSFSTCDCNMLMWSFYADEYRGMCVKYDLTLLKDDDIFYHLFPVLYSDRRASGCELNKMIRTRCGCMVRGTEKIDNKEKPSGDILGLYLRKSSAWAHEEEWRILFSKEHLKTSKEEGEENAVLYKYYQQELPFDCATEIIAGPLMPVETQRHICEIVQRINEDRDEFHQITFRRASIHETEYRLDYNDRFLIKEADDIWGIEKSKSWLEGKPKE